MSEHEIRAALREILEALDRRAGRAARKVILPSLVGAALALGAGGCGQRPAPAPADGAVTDTGGVVDDAPWPKVDGRPQKLDFGGTPLYMAAP